MPRLEMSGITPPVFLMAFGLENRKLFFCILIYALHANGIFEYSPETLRNFSSGFQFSAVSI